MAYGVRIQADLSLKQKFLHLNWGLIFLICVVACVGFAALYSAAGASVSPWAIKQFVRFCVGMVGMVIIAMLFLFDLYCRIYDASRGRDYGACGHGGTEMD